MKKVLIFLTGILISLSSLAQHGNFTDIRIINGDSVLSGTSNGTIFYNRVSNKFRFRQNGSWISIPTGSGGITGSLTSGRVPYASGSSTLNTSPGFEFNPSIYLFTAAENLSFPATLPDHTFISGESHTIIRTSRGSEDAAVFGIGNTVGKTATTFAGNGSFTFGTGNINEGLYSYVGGSNAKVDGQGGFSHALSTGVGIGNPLVYASNGSVNISRNTTSQIDGHGALAVASGIFAGTNGHVSGINSVVLGGYGQTETDSATVRVPRIMSSGGHGFKSTTVSTTTTLDKWTYSTILVDASGGAVTINLPAVASSVDVVFTIKKIDSSINAVTIDGNASETIDGSTTKTRSLQYDFYTIQCDGSNWYIIGQ